jgi:hypothetical protein
LQASGYDPENRTVDHVLGPLNHCANCLFVRVFP